MQYFRQHIFFILVGIFSFTAFLIWREDRLKLLCANSKSCQTSLSEKIENGKPGVFLGEIVIPPRIDNNFLTQLPVLGKSTSSARKHIYIDLSTQTLYAYEDNNLILKTLISSGKWGRTPSGNFHIWSKLRSTRMSGGSGSDYYDLPNVPYVMYFYHDFGLHGAYWHNNFGHEMSHGCVNMRTIDAEILFNWVDGPVENTIGTPVSICNVILDGGDCIQNNPVQ